MNKKIVQIALAVFAVIFVIGGTTYFLLRNRGIEQTLTDAEGQSLSFIGNLPQSGNSPNSESSDTQPNLSGVGIADLGFGAEVVAEDLKKRSINFIERLGSYSSDSDLSNFDDVIPQTAAELELELRSTKSQRLQDFANSDLFIGYTVTAVTSNADLANLDAGTVNVSIDAIRVITGLNVESVINDRETYRVRWIKGDDGKWRVNGISGDF